MYGTFTRIPEEDNKNEKMPVWYSWGCDKVRIFKPYYHKCKKVGLTWEKCNEKYCCDAGEECWYDSEDYYNDVGEGSRK